MLPENTFHPPEEVLQMIHSLDKCSAAQRHRYRVRSFAIVLGECASLHENSDAGDDDDIEEAAQQTFVGLQDVFKTSSRHVLKTSSTRLQRNNFSSSKTS